MASFRALLIAALMASVAAFVPRAPMLARGPARFASRSGPVMMARCETLHRPRALKLPFAHPSLQRPRTAHTSNASSASLSQSHDRVHSHPPARPPLGIA